jgi:Fe-S cluster assembly ATP-binding protein
LKLVSEGINKLIKDDHLTVLLITHYQRILDYIQPDFVHIMVDGRIVKSGGHELAKQLDKMGYEWVKEA